MSDPAWRILFKNAYIFTGERECPGRGDPLVEGKNTPSKATDAALAHAAEFAADRGLSLHTHAREGKAETESALTRFGKSEIAVLKECGVLTSRTEIVHVIWVSDDDIEIIAESGAYDLLVEGRAGRAQGA